jgi:hypothetical protein
MSVSRSETLLAYRVNLNDVVSEIVKIAEEVELSNGSEEDLKVNVEGLLS